MLQPPANELMQAYTVDKRVGNVRNNDEGLIEKHEYEELKPIS